MWKEKNNLLFFDHFVILFIFLPNFLFLPFSPEFNNLPFSFFLIYNVLLIVIFVFTKLHVYICSNITYDIYIYNMLYNYVYYNINYVVFS